jgi:hypothetical protein
MKKPDIVWLVGMTLFWVSFAIAFFIDYLGVFESNNSVFFETLWLSWILWTVGLGIIVAILTSFTAKE